MSQCWTMFLIQKYTLKWIIFKWINIQVILHLWLSTFFHNSQVHATEINRNIGNNITRILNAFFSSGYDKRIRPNYGGPAVEVEITMLIISISSVSEVQMDFTSDFYFRQSWTDPRLRFRPGGDLNELYVGAEVADRIWVPDTFFANEKSAYFHKATTPNTFLRIRANGEILRSIRLTVTASCSMDLQYFPMDRQLCSIQVESYGYSMADIRYKWQKGEASVGILDGLELPQFRITGHRNGATQISLSTGNYSRLYCEIQFARSLGFYLIQIYIPASLIVVISWVSFWLHRNATPARVALGVTTVLTMTTLMSSTNSALPKISYIKSIDVYLGTCFVMVFASLLEYATVGYLGKRIAMRRTKILHLTQLAERHRQNCSAAAAAATTASILQQQQQQQQQQQHQEPNQFDSLNIFNHHNTFDTCPDTRFDTHHQTISSTLMKTRYKLGQEQKVSTRRLHSNRHLNQFDDPDCRNPCIPIPPEPYMPPLPWSFYKNPHTMYGISPSDIDKYSRVVFPVCFVCFNLMYWIIYLHISEQYLEDLVPPGVTLS